MKRHVSQSNSVVRTRCSSYVTGPVLAVLLAILCVCGAPSTGDAAEWTETQQPSQGPEPLLDGDPAVGAVKFCWRADGTPVGSCPNPFADWIVVRFPVFEGQQIVGQTLRIAFGGDAVRIMVRPFFGAMETVVDAAPGTSEVEFPVSGGNRWEVRLVWRTDCIGTRCDGLQFIDLYEITRTVTYDDSGTEPPPLPDDDCIAGTEPLFRFLGYTQGNDIRMSDHRYTTNFYAVLDLDSDYEYESIAGCVLPNGETPESVPLYYYWGQDGNSVRDSFYSTNPSIPPGFMPIGTTGWVFVDQQPGTIPLYRYFSPITADHFYTIDFSELGEGGPAWNYEGVAAYVYPESSDAPDGDGVATIDDNCPTVPNGPQDPSNQEDADGDGVGDVCDNCTYVANGPLAQTGECAAQEDGDLDGYGNACDSDFNNDGATGLDDVGAALEAAQMTSTDPLYDLNCDGAAGLDDASATMDAASVTAVPGPSGLDCAGTVPCTAP